VARLRIGPWMRFGVVVIKPPLLAFTRRDWRGIEHVPPTGGVILASNHISHVDPLTLCDYVLHGLRRIPRFLAKDTLFRGKGIVGRTMRGAGQIPVHRKTADAALALRDAVAALERGECVVIYPEGTVTRDPDKWPMLAKTGVARLALLSGAPVIPIGQWGAQAVLDSYREPSYRLHLLPPKRVSVVAGPAVDLSPWRGREPSGPVLRDATAEIMRAITTIVEDLRGEKAPAEVHDPRHVVPVDTDGRRTA
jgi:1-acyl-sn-glycerol-3-phosphate acyltransferase